MTEHLRLVPQPLAACPTEHEMEMRKALGLRCQQIAVQMAGLILAAEDLKEHELVLDFASMIERLNRHRARLREGA